MSRVLYMASYLVFTTIYMGDTVNSYLTEDETKARVIGQALKGHWHSKWQRWPYFKGIKLRWLNFLRRQTWLGPALSLRGGWYHWLLDEAWVTEEKNLGGGGLYDARVRGCQGAGWWEECGHPSPPLQGPPSETDPAARCELLFPPRTVSAAPCVSFTPSMLLCQLSNLSCLQTFSLHNGMTYWLPAKTKIVWALFICSVLTQDGEHHSKASVLLNLDEPMLRLVLGKYICF